MGAHPGMSMTEEELKVLEGTPAHDAIKAAQQVSPVGHFRQLYSQTQTALVAHRAGQAQLHIIAQRYDRV